RVQRDGLWRRASLALKRPRVGDISRLARCLPAAMSLPAPTRVGCGRCRGEPVSRWLSRKSRSVAVGQIRGVEHIMT
ncbi:MAG: hypothetical protein ACRDQZ_19435, partial [Mycobacteriales bacterium]